MSKKVCKSVQKRADVKSHIAHPKKCRTHAHRTHVQKYFLHAHPTYASVWARVRFIFFETHSLCHSKKD